MKALILSAVIGILPAIAHAQDVIGTATGTIDGAAYDWYFTRENDRSQSTFSATGPFMEIALLGHATPDTTFATVNGIILQLTLNDGVLITYDEVGLQFMPEENYLTAYANARDKPVAVDLTTLVMEGDSLHVAGTATGTLEWTEKPGYPGDPDNTKDVAFAFDVVIPPMN